MVYSQDLQGAIEANPFENENQCREGGFEVDPCNLESNEFLYHDEFEEDPCNLGENEMLYSEGDFEVDPCNLGNNEVLYHHGEHEVVPYNLGGESLNKSAEGGTKHDDRESHDSPNDHEWCDFGDDCEGRGLR